jgi:hypothetical protein
MRAEHCYRGREVYVFNAERDAPVRTGATRPWRKPLSHPQ